jgi:NitT/TauT family transport system permease protein
MSDASLPRVLAAPRPRLIFPAVWRTHARDLALGLLFCLGGEIARIVAGGMAFRQVAITLGRIALGASGAFIIALTLGLLAARRPMVRAFLQPAMILGLTVPGLVWALLCVIWFGVGLTTPVVSIILGITPPLLVQVIEGLRAVDPDLVEMAHVFRFSRLQRLRCVILPSIVPYLVSGARLGFSLAWKVIVLVELFGLSDGVGYQLNSEFASQNVAGVLAWTLVFWAVMAVIEFGIMQTVERRLTGWRRAASV